MTLDQATSSSMPSVFVGTSGWAIPRALAARFEPTGTHLHRYATHFRCAEINSSFHRPHRAATYAKWAAATPVGFRFAVKVPRSITHDRQLHRVHGLLKQFLDECSGLGNRLGPLLVQLPPSLNFSERTVAAFFDRVRRTFDGPVVCEPRHPSWLHDAAENLFRRYRIARVAADPARAPGFERPGGWDGLIYFRLHGSPRVYWSSYSADRLVALARYLGSGDSCERWCIFDNTASGAALDNAWQMMDAATALPPGPAPGSRRYRTCVATSG